jgi:hypothetical protein
MSGAGDLAHTQNQHKGTQGIVASRH